MTVNLMEVLKHFPSTVYQYDFNMYFGPLITKITLKIVIMKAFSELILFGVFLTELRYLFMDLHQ